MSSKSEVITSVLSLKNGKTEEYGATSTIQLTCSRLDSVQDKGADAVLVRTQSMNGDDNMGGYQNWNGMIDYQNLTNLPEINFKSKRKARAQELAEYIDHMKAGPVQ
jgi:hypothetical protein